MLPEKNLGKTKFDPKEFWSKKYLVQEEFCPKKLCTATNTAAVLCGDVKQLFLFG